PISHRPRPAVITQSTPYGQNVRFGSGSQCMNIRKSLQEPIVVVDHSRDTRLLQHDLGDPDAVWIPGCSPGELPLLFAKPAQQPFPHFGHNVLVQSRAHPLSVPDSKGTLLLETTDIPSRGISRYGAICETLVYHYPRPDFCPLLN